MQTFLKIDRVIDKIQEYFCFVLFMMMVMVGGVSVFSRFIFNMSITWAEELMRFSCIWLTFVGAALTVRVDGHVSIDIIENMIKNPKVKMVYYCVGRLVGIIFLILLFKPAVILVMKTGNSMAAALNISFKYIYLAVPVGIINMLWAYISALPHFAKKKLHEDNIPIVAVQPDKGTEEKGEDDK